MSFTSLKILDLWQHKDRHPISLSGGQKQRLAVAVSRVAQKNILVFDEPTSGLDLKSMGEVSKLIKSLADENKVIFIISHDNKLVSTIFTRTVIIRKSEITTA